MRALKGFLLILLLATGWTISAQSPVMASVQPIVAQTIEVESIIGNWLMEVEAEQAFDAVQAEDAQQTKDLRESVIETPATTH